MNYTYGDNVRVRSWEELTARWPMVAKTRGITAPKVGGLVFSPNMKKYCGKVYTVISVNRDTYNLCDERGDVLCRTFDDCLIPWLFNDEMLEPAVEVPTPSVSFEELFGG